MYIPFQSKELMLFGYPLRFVHDRLSIIQPDDHNNKKYVLEILTNILETCIILLQNVVKLDKKTVEEFIDIVNQIKSLVSSIRTVNYGDYVLDSDFNMCLTAMLQISYLLNKINDVYKECEKFNEIIKRINGLIIESSKHFIEKGKFLFAEIQNFHIIFLKTIAEAIELLYYCLLKNLQFYKSYLCYFDGRDYSIINKDNLTILLTFIKSCSMDDIGNEYIANVYYEIKKFYDKYWMLYYVYCPQRKLVFGQKHFDLVFELEYYIKQNDNIKLVQHYIASIFTPLFTLYNHRFKSTNNIDISFNFEPDLIFIKHPPNKNIPLTYIDINGILTLWTYYNNELIPIFIHKVNLVNFDTSTAIIDNIVYDFSYDGRFLLLNKLNDCISIYDLNDLTIKTLRFSNKYFDSLEIITKKVSIELSESTWYWFINMPFTIKFVKETEEVLNTENIENLNIEQGSSLYYNNGTVYYNPENVIDGCVVYIKHRFPKNCKFDEITFYAFSTEFNNIVVNIPSFDYWFISIITKKETINLNLYLMLDIFLIGNTQYKVSKIFDKAVIFVIPLFVIYYVPYNEKTVDWVSFEKEFAFASNIIDFIVNIYRTYFEGAWSKICCNFDFIIIKLDKLKIYYPFPLNVEVSTSMYNDVVSTLAYTNNNVYVNKIGKCRSKMLIKLIDSLGNIVNTYTIHLLFNANLLNNIIFNSYIVHNIDVSGLTVFTIDDKIIFVDLGIAGILDFEKGTFKKLDIEQFLLSNIFGSNYLLTFDKKSNKLNIFDINKGTFIKTNVDVLPHILDNNNNYTSFNIYALGYKFVLYGHRLLFYTLDINYAIDYVYGNISGMNLLYNVNCDNLFCISNIFGNEVVNTDKAINNFNINLYPSDYNDFECVKDKLINVMYYIRPYNLYIYDVFSNKLVKFVADENYEGITTLFGNLTFLGNDKEVTIVQPESVCLGVHGFILNSSKALIEDILKNFNIVRVTFIPYSLFEKLSDKLNDFKGYTMFVAFLKDPKKIKNVIKFAEKVKANHVWISPTSDDAVDFVFNEFYNFMTKINKDVPKIYGIFCTTVRTLEFDENYSLKLTYNGDVVPLLLFKNNVYVEGDCGTILNGYINYFIPLHVCKGTYSENTYEPSWYIYLYEWFNNTNNALDFTTISEVIGKPITSFFGLFGYFCKKLFKTRCRVDNVYYINNEKYVKIYKPNVINVIVKILDKYFKSKFNKNINVIVQDNRITTDKPIDPEGVECLWIPYWVLGWTITYPETYYYCKYLIVDIDTPLLSNNLYKYAEKTLNYLVDCFGKVYAEFIKDVFDNDSIYKIVDYIVNLLRYVYAFTVPVVIMRNYKQICRLAENVTQGYSNMFAMNRISPFTFNSICDYEVSVDENCWYCSGFLFDYYKCWWHQSKNENCIDPWELNIASLNYKVYYYSGETNMYNTKNVNYCINTVQFLKDKKFEDFYKINDIVVSRRYLPINDYDLIDVDAIVRDCCYVNEFGMKECFMHRQFVGIKLVINYGNNTIDFVVPFCPSIIRKIGTCYNIPYGENVYDNTAITDLSTTFVGLTTCLCKAKVSVYNYSFVAVNDINKLMTSTSNIVDYVTKGYSDFKYDIGLIIYNNLPLIWYPEKSDGNMKITLAPLSIYVDVNPIALYKQVSSYGCPNEYDMTSNKIYFGRILLPLLYALTKLISNNEAEFVDIYVIFDDSINDIPTMYKFIKSIKYGLYTQDIIYRISEKTNTKIIFRMLIKEEEIT